MEITDEPPPPCEGTGVHGDHHWIKYSDDSIGCEACLLDLPAERILEIITEYDRVLRTGISVLQGELDDYRTDFEAAAGEVLVSTDEMPPGSNLRRVVISNRLLQHARDEARAHAHEAWQRLSRVLKMIEEGRPHVELAVECHAALEKVSGLP